jgi:spermidine dehydrogenase
MHRPITRRDFLHGVGAAAALTAGGVAAQSSTTPGTTAAAAGSPATAGSAPAAGSTWPQDTPGYYPPTLVGMRGSHPGSFEAAHALRDGSTWPEVSDTGEQYDLIVVGGGISGLAAAHFFRTRSAPGSRILILDNHDDFGGHAKRNEFHLGGRLHLLNGGTLEIDSPRPYGPVAAGLLTTLGIDVPALAKKVEHRHFYERHGLYGSVFFDAETFGADRLVVGMGDHRPLAECLAEAPLSARARREITALEQAKIDYLPGLSSAQKKDRLSRMSYEAFLRDVVGVETAVLQFYYARTMGEWGCGTDAVSALDCWGFDFPGFQGMHLEKGSTARMSFTPAGYKDTGGSFKLHFPDGNATIARLLVRDLIPAAVPGHDAVDVVTARVNYAALDRADSPVRLRLSSMVVRARHVGEPRAGSPVEVTYVRDGRAFKARASRTVLACYNMMIPYLCPELPEAQKEALHGLIKTPLVYTSVALKNWQAFRRLQVASVYAPGSYHSYFHLNPQVDIGAYRSPKSADEPILLHMVRTPCQRGLPELQQHEAGRRELLATPFATFEREIRSQLARTLHAGGFDAARDITAITVNRWPHGYAPEPNPLWDPDGPETTRPYYIGRASFGSITIANSDSGGAAYTDVAIEQGYRAVDELLRT